MSERCGWCNALDSHEPDCPALDLAECCACGLALDDDEVRWLSGEPLCPDCHDAEVGGWAPWHPDVAEVRVVDVAVGEYL